jgi:hypothetical protein
LRPETTGNRSIASGISGELDAAVTSLILFDEFLCQKAPSGIQGLKSPQTDNSEASILVSEKGMFF